jgi:hypothetical protein
VAGGVQGPLGRFRSAGSLCDHRSGGLQVARPTRQSVPSPAQTSVKYLVDEDRNLCNRSLRAIVVLDDTTEFHAVTIPTSLTKTLAKVSTAISFLGS